MLMSRTHITITSLIGSELGLKHKSAYSCRQCKQDLHLSAVLTLINHVQDWNSFKTYHDLLILADINTWALPVNSPGHILNLS